MLKSTSMRYHIPDNTWACFGIDNFERYVEKFVVSGRFHRDVPSEVVEGYCIVEHIMAHAYYHYPAMDEALAKLLRMLEMAVKLRCIQLGIDIGRKNLQKSIDLVFPPTTANEFNFILHQLRGTRNFLMHPDGKSLFGSISMSIIYKCIIIINALFLPEQYFSDANTELESIQTCCQKFRKGLFVLEYNGHRYIVYESEFIEAYFVGGQWKILCAFHAVPNHFSEMVAKQSYPPPLVCIIKNFQIGEDQICGSVGEDDRPLALSIDFNPENIALLAKFDREKSAMNEIQQDHFQTCSFFEIAEVKSKSRYACWGS